jgi:hypothetical protein
VVGAVALTRQSEAAPDAAQAPSDIASDDTPVVLAERPAGRCPQVLPGVEAPEVAEIMAGDRVVADVKTYRHAQRHRVCAKLVKPEGSAFHGEMTHLALTVCGDEDVCAHDWHAYRIDAGPVVVASTDGCVSWRVSMSDQAGAWPVRDRLGRTARCD